MGRIQKVSHTHFLLFAILCLYIYTIFIRMAEIPNPHVQGVQIRQTKWMSSRGLNGYIHWLFTTSVPNLLGSLFAIFFFKTTLWAIFIYAMGRHQPNCIDVGGKDFATGGNHFIDAYAISWTTFSTVVRALCNVKYLMTVSLFYIHTHTCFPFFFLTTRVMD
jgi:hypothetical protein